MRPVGRSAALLFGPAGALLLIWCGALHFYLWVDYFHRVRTIGPLFVVQGTVAVLCGAAIVASRKRMLALVGAVILAATAGALLVSAWVGLFGYHERLRAPYVGMSLVVEILGAVALLLSMAVSNPRA